MILPDVNILVHAFRADTAEHHLCRTWLEGVVNGEARFGMSTQVLSGLIRVVTHPKVFTQPSSLDEVLHFCGVVLNQPLCVVISRAPGIGRFSPACVPPPMPEAISSRMPGWRP